ncbi:MAG: NUDIX hydrolase [Bernardetiaceae bacterium]|nr:NUDIX hydrolase [Bernardetiaceae bacterium]
MYTYEYPRPALTVDCVIFAWDKASEAIKVMLIERAHEPFANHWAFPGGFVDMDETVDTAAARELEEETGIKNVFMEQLYTFSSVDRDPRGRVVSVAYYALINMQKHPAKAASDAKSVKWFGLSEIPALAFDHQQILDMAYERLKSKVRYQPIGFELLPRKFPLSELQLLYEQILNTKLDKRNFRRKILKTGLLKPLEEFQTRVAHRAARLYTFDDKKYKALTREGFSFEI